MPLACFDVQPAVGGIFYDTDGKGATIELVPRAPYGTGELPAIQSFFYTTDNSWPQIGVCRLMPVLNLIQHSPCGPASVFSQIIL